MKRIGAWLCCAAPPFFPEPGQSGEPDRIAVEFRPPTLAPGDYHLLVTLTDPTGAIQTSSAAFTVPAGGGG